MIGIHFQHIGHQIFQLVIKGDEGDLVSQPWGAGAGFQFESLHGIFPGEWWHSRQGLEERSSQGIDIAARIEGLTHALLRTHVEGAAENFALESQSDAASVFQL